MLEYSFASRKWATFLIFFAAALAGPLIAARVAHASPADTAIVHLGTARDQAEKLAKSGRFNEAWKKLRDGIVTAAAEMPTGSYAHEGLQNSVALSNLLWTRLAVRPGPEESTMSAAAKAEAGFIILDTFVGAVARVFLHLDSRLAGAAKSATTPLLETYAGDALLAVAGEDGDSLDATRPSVRLAALAQAATWTTQLLTSAGLAESHPCALSLIASLSAETPRKKLSQVVADRRRDALAIADALTRPDAACPSARSGNRATPPVLKQSQTLAATAPAVAPANTEDDGVDFDQVQAFARMARAAQAREGAKPVRRARASTLGEARAPRVAAPIPVPIPAAPALAAHPSAGNHGRMTLPPIPKTIDMN